MLSSENRAAAEARSVYLGLVTNVAQAIYLQSRDLGGEKRHDIQSRVLDLLGENSVPTRAKLRERLSVKSEKPRWRTGVHPVIFRSYGRAVSGNRHRILINLLRSHPLPELIC